MAGLSARTTDPQTSQEAASDSTAREAIRITLLCAYAEALLKLDDGLTDEEAMALAGFSLIDDGHRRRCSDLRETGLIAQVVRDGEPVTRRSERTGKQRMVCTLTEAGVDAVNALTD
ncbi:hypothetical protein SEA_PHRAPPUCCINO_93 [Mycobacterium phage Phrappuccino]|uniref:Uncharacterized protein n=1 Tax=Mycobacterium phage Phrappuccino TaxID=2591223 RepID=A0A514DDT3_9CAUD|nr:hypothetical protein KHQ87_gp093 [Mycobacterium phage Phrappuccino]QDH91768.1 hypothetical protein SEA_PHRAPPUCCINO_93 [Mycobacterium phage Phrappuccino]QIQ63210.1 hypothetical protein SEA_SETTECANDELA_93 [Mycobacterium phage Settecandela]